jgi:hypothetical protein
MLRINGAERAAHMKQITGHVDISVQQHTARRARSIRVVDRSFEVLPAYLYTSLTNACNPLRQTPKYGRHNPVSRHLVLKPVVTTWPTTLPNAYETVLWIRLSTGKRHRVDIFAGSLKHLRLGHIILRSSRCIGRCVWFSIRVW